MKKSAEKLTFTPTIYRDWTILFSQLAYKAFTTEFKRQFGFRYTDTMYVWESEVVTIYRAIEEHRHQMFEMLEEKLSKNPQFIEEETARTIRDMNTLQPFFVNMLQSDLSTRSQSQLKHMLAAWSEKVVEGFPRFAIIMYFPQQVELFGLREKYKKEFRLTIDARAKVHDVLTPIGNAVGAKFADDALRRVKGPRKLSRYLTMTELKECWKKNPNIRHLEHSLKQRQRYWMIAGNQVTQEKVEDYIQKQGWNLEIPKIHHDRTLKGSAVYPAGNITGFARIVPNKDSLSQIQPHDIIVAPMTTPEYSAVFSQVKGIVTDEGGITSHAAILSREMKIPAIVGTAIASKVLRDGDEIELDTKKGAVQILSINR